MVQFNHKLSDGSFLDCVEYSLKNQETAKTLKKLIRQEKLLMRFFLLSLVLPIIPAIVLSKLKINDSIMCLLGILTVGCIFVLGHFVFIRDSKARPYFKTEFVKSELNEYIDIKFINPESVYLNLNTFCDAEIDLKKSQNLLTCSADSLMITNLALGNNTWNSGYLNDEICGSYKGIEFRFLDIELSYSTGTKSSKSYDIFHGQAFIVSLKKSASQAIQYEIKMHISDIDKTDLSKAFERYPFNPNYDAFAQMNQRAPAVSVPPNYKTSEFYNSKLSEEELQKIYCEQETETFVEGLSAMATLYRDTKWIIRIQNNQLIFIVGRKHDFFEIDTDCYDKTIENFESDLQEFMQTLDALTLMACK